VLTDKTPVQRSQGVQPKLNANDYADLDIDQAAWPE
jgi:hypothetical protein